MISNMISAYVRRCTLMDHLHTPKNDTRFGEQQPYGNVYARVGQLCTCDVQQPQLRYVTYRRCSWLHKTIMAQPAAKFCICLDGRALNKDAILQTE
jgi:hypothetical protein